jgi:bacteriorhodopsin
VYPVLWVFGTEGLGVVSLGVETLVYALLDITAKIVFGYLLLDAMSSVAGDETTSTTTSTASSEN